MDGPAYGQGRSPLRTCCLWRTRVPRRKAAQTEPQGSGYDLVSVVDDRSFSTYSAIYRDGRHVRRLLRAGTRVLPRPRHTHAGHNDRQRVRLPPLSHLPPRAHVTPRQARAGPVPPPHNQREGRTVLVRPAGEICLHSGLPIQTGPQPSTRPANSHLQPTPASHNCRRPTTRISRQKRSEPLQLDEASYRPSSTAEDPYETKLMHLPVTHYRKPVKALAALSTKLRRYLRRKILDALLELQSPRI